MFTAPHNFDSDKGDDIQMGLIQLQCESLQIKFSVGAVSSFMPTYVTSKTVSFLAEYADIW
jgi:hypothetical protein